MGTRIHQKRAALLHRLEEKYSQKLTKLSMHQRRLQDSVSAAHGMRISKNQYLDYETIGSVNN